MIKKSYNSSIIKLSSVDLIEEFASACSIGNEMDNRTRIEELKKELLRRLEKCK